MRRVGRCLIWGSSVICACLTLACSKGAAPGPTQQAAAPAQPTAAPAAPQPPPAAVPPVAAPTAAAPAGLPALMTGETNIAGIVAELTECTRKEGVLSIKVRLRNTNPAGKHVGIISGRNYESYYLSAANKKYFILKDSEGTYLTPNADMFGNLGVDIDAGGQYNWWAKFPAPPPEVKAVTLYSPIAPPLEDIPVTDK